VIEDDIRNKPCCLSDTCMLVNFALDDLHILLDVGDNNSPVVCIPNWPFLFIAKHHTHVVECVLGTH
jgi:hypothetical protein